MYIVHEAQEHVEKHCEYIKKEVLWDMSQEAAATRRRQRALEGLQRRANQWEREMYLLVKSNENTPKRYSITAKLRLNEAVLRILVRWQSPSNNKGTDSNLYHRPQWLLYCSRRMIGLSSAWKNILQCLYGQWHRFDKAVVTYDPQPPMSHSTSRGCPAVWH